MALFCSFALPLYEVPSAPVYLAPNHGRVLTDVELREKINRWKREKERQKSAEPENST